MMMYVQLMFSLPEHFFRHSRHDFLHLHPHLRQEVDSYSRRGQDPPTMMEISSHVLLLLLLQRKLRETPAVPIRRAESTTALSGGSFLFPTPRFRALEDRHHSHRPLFAFFGSCQAALLPRCSTRRRTRRIHRHQRLVVRFGGSFGRHLRCCRCSFCFFCRRCRRFVRDLGV